MGEKKGVARKQSSLVRWVLLLVVIIVLGLLLLNSFSQKSTGNVIYDSSLDLGWSFSQGVKSDLTNMDVRAISGGNIRFVNDGSDGKALAFDGYRDYVKVSKIYNPLSNSFPLSSVTVAGRFKTTSLSLPTVFGSGGSDDIVEQGSEITGSWVALRDGFVLSPDTSGAVTFWAFINGNWYAAGPSSTSSSKITLNTWEYWAGTYDGSELRLYKNGVLVAARAVSGKLGTGAGGATASVSDLYIGADGDIPGRFFNGRIDEVLIYTRALGAMEIKNLYDNPHLAASGSGSGAVCGNGVKEGTEVCDTGANNGACPKTCSATCTTNSCSGSGSGSEEPPAVCGNGKKEGTETCDAGSSNGACPRLCSATCTANTCVTVTSGSGSGFVCGDGKKEGTEVCDTGANNGACPKTCSATCTTNSCSGISTQNNPGSTGGAGNNDNSGGGGGGVIRILSAEEFSAGKLIKAKIGDIVRFKVTDVYDSVDVRAISDTQATFLVTSIPQIVVLSKGGSKKIDVNGDGVLDVLLTLENVNRAQQQVDFNLKSIKESVSSSNTAPTGNVQSSGNALSSGASPSGGDEGFKLNTTVLVLGVILALAILAALAKFIISRKKDETQE